MNLGNSGFRQLAFAGRARGVPRSVAMKMVGHKTEAIYRRYAIVAEADLMAGGEKLTSLHQVQGFTPRSIIPFPESR